jgi:hypothetical protein
VDDKTPGAFLFGNEDSVAGRRSVEFAPDGTAAFSGAASFGGAVTLPSDPSTALQAATKQYVDNHVPASSGMDQIFPLSGYGLLAASGDPVGFLVSATTVTNNLWYARVWIPANTAITNLWAGCTVAGVWDNTLTPNQLAVFTDAGVQAGLTADTGALYATAGWVGGAIAGGPIAAQGSGRFVYVGWCARGQTNALGMQFASQASGTFPAFQTGPATTHRRAFFTGASSAGFPASFDPTSYATLTAFVPLVGVS